jgi:hypothetical protein
MITSFLCEKAPAADTAGAFAFPVDGRAQLVYNACELKGGLDAQIADGPESNRVG